MRDVLTTIVGISSIVAVFLSLYTIIDSKLGTKKKEINSIRDKLSEHETRIIATERVTGVVEDFMEDLLLDSLGSKKRRRDDR